MRKSGKPALLRELIAVIILLAAFSLAAFSQDENAAVRNSEKSFTVLKEVWRTPAKSQGWTGTCWCFSTTSFLESEAYRLGRGEFELSEMFSVYNAYLEKAERYVRLHGKTNFGEGGLSHDLIYLVKKYGIVRDTDYSGLKEGRQMHNHSGLDSAMAKVADGALENDKGMSAELLEAIQEILDSKLGEIPLEIDLDGNTLTPKRFADEVLALPYDDYVEITSYSYAPFYGQVELLVPDNWMHYSGYYNVPLDDLIGIIDYAVGNDYSLAFDMDVSEGMYLSFKGYAVVDADEEGRVVDQAERDKMFADFSTTDDHIEHCVGLGRDEQGKKYYLIKNSQGATVGPYAGHEFVSENYVRAKVLAVMVHKDGIPQEIRGRLGIE